MVNKNIRLALIAMTGITKVNASIGSRVAEALGIVRSKTDNNDASQKNKKYVFNFLLGLLCASNILLEDDREADEVKKLLYSTLIANMYMAVTIHEVQSVKANTSILTDKSKDKEYFDIIQRDAFNLCDRVHKSVDDDVKSEFTKIVHRIGQILASKKIQFEDMFEGKLDNLLKKIRLDEGLKAQLKAQLEEIKTKLGQIQPADFIKYYAYYYTADSIKEMFKIKKAGSETLLSDFFSQKDNILFNVAKKLYNKEFIHLGEQIKHALLNAIQNAKGFDISYLLGVLEHLTFRPNATIGDIEKTIKEAFEKFALKHSNEQRQNAERIENRIFRFLPDTTQGIIKGMKAKVFKSQDKEDIEASKKMYTLIFSSALDEKFNIEKDGLVTHNLKDAKILVLSLFAIRTNQIMKMMNSGEYDRVPLARFMDDLVKEFMEAICTINSQLRLLQQPWGKHNQSHIKDRRARMPGGDMLFGKKILTNLINVTDQFYARIEADPGATRYDFQFDIMKFMADMEEILVQSTHQLQTLQDFLDESETSVNKPAVMPYTQTSQYTEGLPESDTPINP